MADSHDNLKSIEKAVNFFNHEQVDLVLHAGDLISPFTARKFMDLESEFSAVFGNNDGEREGLQRAYQDLCHIDDFKEFKLENKFIAMIHGVNQGIVDAIAQSGKYDVLIRGHTHNLEVINGETLIINPGETCGYLSGAETVVLLDMDDLNYQIIYL